MARFLVGTVPVLGHVNPATSIVQKLIERGHEVWWYTGRVFQPMVEATGAKFVPMVNSLDYSDSKNVPQSLTEERSSLTGLAQLKFDLKHFFIDAAIGQVKDSSNLLAEFPADVILGDSFFLGASWISEQRGIPWAQFGISGLAMSSLDTAPFGLGLQPSASKLGRLRNSSLNWLFQNILFRDILAYTNKLRASIKLPLTSKSFFDVISPFLYLAGTIPDFEYPRCDLPPQVHFVGPFLPKFSTEFTPPSWWEDLKTEQPVVHVTQGTVATETEQLIIPTLRALAEEDILVIATTGGKLIETVKLESIPKNARIEQFIPYHHLFPYVDVMITNGGYNGVQIALAHGIPLIAAGKTEDKPEICSRIEWSKVGINLRTNTPTPTQIRKAVQQILSETKFTARAKYFQTEISNYDAPTRSANLLERLAISKRPILRT